MTDVIGLGTVVVDHLMLLEAEPEFDSKHQALEDRFQIGGPVPTALVLLQRFGCSCRFIGGWGRDAFGQMISDDLSGEGVDVSCSLQSDALQTGIAHVWIDQSSGQRTIACRRPVGMEEALRLDPEWFAGCRMLHLDGWPAGLALEAARHTRQAGGRVALDTGSAKPEMRALIEHVDVLNCPRQFLREFLKTDDMEQGAQTLAQMGPSMVTVTDGANGAVMLTGGELLRRAAAPITAVDTCGAGDVFSGSLIFAVLQDWGPEKVLTFAMTTAALKCTKMGNREALPLLEDVLKQLEGD